MFMLVFILYVCLKVMNLIFLNEFLFILLFLSILDLFLFYVVIFCCLNLVERYV